MGADPAANKVLITTISRCCYGYWRELVPAAMHGMWAVAASHLWREGTAKCRARERSRLQLILRNTALHD